MEVNAGCGPNVGGSEQLPKSMWQASLPVVATRQADQQALAPDATCRQRTSSRAFYLPR